MDQELLEEIGRPERAALIVWDVQNALVDRIFNRAEFLAHTNELIAAARKRGVAIFFSKITPLPDQFQSPPRKHLWKNRNLGLSADGLELTIAPSRDDIVIPKNTASIFVGTNFELMVRNAGLPSILSRGPASRYTSAQSFAGDEKGLNRMSAPEGQAAAQFFDRHACIRPKAGESALVLLGAMNRGEEPIEDVGESRVGAGWSSR